MFTEEFLTFCTNKGYKDESCLNFNKALSFAHKILRHEKRLAGDSFFDHNLRVGKILVESKSEPVVVVGGILHGILAYVPKDDIEARFGKEVVCLLEAVAQLKKLKVKSRQLEAEALRKIIMTTMRDTRAVFIMLANKADNMESVHVFSPKEQKRLATEVLEIYAPLAYQLGLEKVRVKLENRAFQILHPRKYQEIEKFLEGSREQREKNIEQAISLIRSLASGKTEIVKIKGRPKHIYSIYRKMTKRGVKLNEQYDLLGIRVILPTIKDCYVLLGLLHENFDPIEGRLKDYIANPKPNFYRSIHTAVKLKLPKGKIAEVQLRTPEMDEFAEEGLASHWKYKGGEGLKSDHNFEKKIGWLRGILELQKEAQYKELIEAAKVDLFGDKIYCYTPKGDVKELPKGATILDFAYLVHQEIGNHATGGRINGIFVPLKRRLSSGDVVEIVTNKKQRPRRSWLKVVVSARARQKIRKSLQQHEKLPALHFRRFKPAVKEEQGILVSSEEFPKAVCMPAKCCSALPGEAIIGIITKRRIISVHKEECRTALKEEKRWVAVQWRETFNRRIRFFVNAKERSGVLADLLHTIASAGFEVKEAKAKLLGPKEAQCSFAVIPRDLEHLKELVERVGKVKGVRRIFFE